MIKAFRLTHFSLSGFPKWNKKNIFDRTYYKDMMNTDILKLYKQLESMEATKEVTQIKNQIKETLYQNLRMHFLELTSIGRVIGYNELQEELRKAIELIEMQQ
jgi:hypothetical protein